MNMKSINISTLNINWNTCAADGGSFPVNGARYDGNWVEAPATDADGNAYRVIWTMVDWDAFNADGGNGADWGNPDYILDDSGNCRYSK
jgi:hypothetical protein